KAGDLPGHLRALAERADAPAAVRVEALAAIPGNVGALSPDLFSFLTAAVSPQQPAAQRVMAADVLGRAKLTSPQLTALADALRGAGPLEIGRLLPAYEQSSDEPVGLHLVAALKEAKSSRALR